MSIDYINPDEKFLRSIDVHGILPQQEPFVMIGTITRFDTTTISTETVVKSTNLFVNANKLCTTGMIENIAQTCAARIGYVNKYILKKSVQIGVIASVRGMVVYSNPYVGDTIATTVKIVGQVLGMMLAEATVSCGGLLLAKTQIKLAVKDEERQ